jgi:ribosomal protein L37AE/L43A
MIAERYTSQFYPSAIYLQTTVALESGCGELFVSSGRLYEKQGWRDITQDTQEEQAPSEEEPSTASIPPLNVGEQVLVSDIQQQQKQTSPPKPYTDSSLLNAMTSIHKHVKNPQVAQLLKDVKGIGTVATRAGIIEKLVQHKLIQRKSKQFHPTDVGVTHYKLMPPEITDPDMAGLFELKTQEVERGDLTKEDFLDILGNFINTQTQSKAQWQDNAKKLGFAEKQRKASKPCRNCKSPMKGVVSKLHKNKLYLCEACDSIYANDGGNVGFCIKGPLNKSDEKARQERLNERLKDAPPCPECASPILKVKPNSGKKPFWGCRECNSKFADFAGEIGPMFVQRGESVQSEADGPQCPDCGNPMHRRTTNKKQPMLACDHCQSMCWYDKGKPGKFFKRGGEMITQETK